MSRTLTSRHTASSRNGPPGHGHPDLTGQWQHRLRLIGTGDARHPSPWLNAITHPELLALASLLLTARRRGIDVEHEAPSRLGFPYQPFPGEPLAPSLLDPRKAISTENQKAPDSQGTCQPSGR
jgi:hypothetical protein